MKNCHLVSDLQHCYSVCCFPILDLHIRPTEDQLDHERDHHDDESDHDHDNDDDDLTTVILDLHISPTEDQLDHEHDMMMT